MRPVPLCVRQEEAAAMLSISRRSLREEVLPQIRVIRRGRRTLIPVAELARWVDESAVGL